MVTRDSPVALYRQIADDIAASIGRTYRPGQRLPSESAFMEKYGVSRVTVRMALSYLADRGLVVRKQGRGTFASTPRIHHDLQGLSGFHDSLISMGISPETKLLEFGVISVGPYLQDILGLTSDRTLGFKRLYIVDGEPLALVITHFPEEYIGRISREIMTQSPSYEVLKNTIGVHILRADLTIRVQSMSSEIAELLRSDQHSILELERITYGEYDVAVEHTRLVLRSDAYEFGLTISGGVELTTGIRAAPRPEAR